MCWRTRNGRPAPASTHRPTRRGRLPRHPGLRSHAAGFDTRPVIARDSDATEGGAEQADDHTDAADSSSEREHHGEPDSYASALKDNLKKSGEVRDIQGDEETKGEDA